MSVGPLTAALFKVCRVAYGRRYRVELAAADADGVIRLGALPAPPSPEELGGLVAEALRFGEPVVQAVPEGWFCWAVPLTTNGRCDGGLIAQIDEGTLFPSSLAEPRHDLRQACSDLRRLAEERHLVNAHWLAEHRRQQLAEDGRAVALQRSKREPPASVLEAYLREEAELIRTLRHGDRQAAVAIVNRSLVAIYHHAGSDQALTGSLLVELLVMLGRGAVESGADHAEVLRLHRQQLDALQGLQGERALAGWLRHGLDGLMDLIERHHRAPSDILLRRAMAYLEDHCCDEDIDRDTVAEFADLAPATFSRLIKRRLGRTFTDQLNHLRIERAKQLVVDGHQSLLQIAYATGFKDPSYFTKVFRRHVGMTPKAYRGFNRR